MTYTEGAWTVIAHPEVSKWLAGLDGKSTDQVLSALERLSQVGPSLGRPLVDTLTGTNELTNLKELRPGSAKRSEIRILFVFNPLRQAFLLVAGDKAGEWNKWYKRMIPVAEQRFREHLDSIGT